MDSTLHGCERNGAKIDDANRSSGIRVFASAEVEVSGTADSISTTRRSPTWTS
jgi:hypothetical protein